MPQFAMNKILTDNFKLDPNFLKSTTKIKKLYVTDDGDIVDNYEMAKQFVKGVFTHRDTTVKQWFSTVRESCEFVIEIYHPDYDDKFIDIVSKCTTTYDLPGLPIFYYDSIMVYKSTDENVDKKPIGANLAEPLLVYLKSNGLIGKVDYRIN